MIHEDLLLSRIDILENKLSCYQKNITNEKLQEQITQLQDEKEVYQVSIECVFIAVVKFVVHFRVFIIHLTTHLCANVENR